MNDESAGTYHSQSEFQNDVLSLAPSTRWYRSQLTVAELHEVCYRIRRLTIQMIAIAGMGHPGSSLSCIEILVALYYRVMRWSPLALGANDRDRFVLSKGHAAPALYAVLIDQNVIPTTEVMRLRQLGSSLQGHPDPRFTAGVEFATGSLGQGLSAAVGMALGLRRRGLSTRVFVIVGDGECQEGQVWEAANFAASQMLDNLTVVIDDNRLQHDGRTASFVGVADLGPRWSAFGWSVVTVDGHNIEELIDALEKPSPRRRPLAILARTVKGKGVEFMEDQTGWHSVEDKRMLATAIDLVRSEL